MASTLDREGPVPIIIVMFGKVVPWLLALLVVGCPLICGSAQKLHAQERHAQDASAPSREIPHDSHDGCTLDQCFCSGPSAPTHGPAFALLVIVAPVWASPCDGAGESAARPEGLAVAQRPPRALASDLSLPLLL